MTKTTVAGVLLLLMLVCCGTAEAVICTDEDGNRIPCVQDPGGGGGGGGGGWCAHPTCWGCGWPQQDGYQACLEGAGSSCNCEYPDGVTSCVGVGECEYTGP